MKQNQILNKLIVIGILFLTFSPLKAIVIENEVFNYKLNLLDSCDVTFSGKDSSLVCIVSPDRMTTFYIIGMSTDDSGVVFTNDFMGMADSLYFNGLNREPDDVKKPFFLARQDHYYYLEDSVFCHTRILLQNDKAILLGGFSKNGDTTFIDDCIDNFKSATMLGQIATCLLAFLWFVLAFLLLILWGEEKKKLLACLLAVAVIAASYYFHFVLDYSINLEMMSALG